MDESCRLCTAQNCNLILLFDIDNITKVKALLKIKEGDGLPQRSCDSCLLKINDINSFVTTCEKSYEYFKNTLLALKSSSDNESKEDNISEDYENFKFEPQVDSIDGAEKCALHPVAIKVEMEEVMPEFLHNIRNNELLMDDKNEVIYKNDIKNCSIYDVDEHEVNMAIEIKNKKKIERKRRTRNCGIENNTNLNTDKWKCQYCPKSFTTDKILRRHMQNIHTNPNFKCIKCGFECTNKSNCAGHVKRKHFKELNMEFEELLQFVLEKDSETNDANFSDLPFACDCCTRSFAKETDLQKHKNRVHISDPDSVKLFGCKKCGSKYTYRKTAVKHIRNVHYESRTELVKAEIDEYLIQYGQPKIEPNIIKSPKIENNEEATVHECPVCHLKYSRAIILKSHFARFHLSEDEKKKRKKKVYLCQQCGKNFSARSAFKYHVQTHFGEKEFKCSECSKAYYTKHLLLSHMRKHTGDMSNRQLECEICHKRWPSKTALERHMNVHGQKQPRNFMCSICGNAFYSNYHLKSHMLRHTKENNFICTETGCNASFRTDGSRKKHYYNFHVSDDQKQFSCDICQKKFFRKAYLADHLRKHGKAAEYMLHLYRQKVPHEGINE